MKKGETKKKSERKEALMRVVILIVSGIILELWGYLIMALIVVNWLIALFVGKRSQDVADFCEYWNTEIYIFFRYITGVTNERPFPFTKMQRISKFVK